MRQSPELREVNYNFWCCLQKIVACIVVYCFFHHLHFKKHSFFSFSDTQVRTRDRGIIRLVTTVYGICRVYISNPFFRHCFRVRERKLNVFLCILLNCSANFLLFRFFISWLCKKRQIIVLNCTRSLFYIAMTFS